MTNAQYATKQDLKSLENKLDNKIDTKIDQAVKEITGVIRDVVSEFSKQFDELNTRMKKIEENQNELLQTVDHFIKVLENYEIENVARDAQLKRIESWVQKIAKETGVKLEY